ncbi:MAG: hypothetical protein PSX80_03415 [bacterium]|nr:hypothetical protein [bacterium]
MKHTIDFFRNAIEERGSLSEDERTLLFMLPVIQVAWAHGAISPREALAIFEMAREDGIDSTHWFNEKIDAFLVYQPSAQFYEDALELIRSTVGDMTVRQRESAVSQLISRSEKVAAAAGDRSPMDVDHRVSEQESRVIEMLYRVFGRLE